MKVFANKKMKQFIIILVTVIMLFNVIAPAPLALQVQAAEEFDIVDAGGGLITGILGKFFSAVSLAFQKLLNATVHIASEFTSGDVVQEEDVFVSSIVYNELNILNANIFETDEEKINPLFKPGDGIGLSGIVKTWYNITRLMALAASLVVLVYVAIKIILSSTGQSKAKYTELLKDWLLSLLLIFSLHYIMAAILFCSDAIVSFFSNTVNNLNNGIAFSYDELQSEAWNFSDGMSSLIYSLVWLAFLGATFVFLILYIKRLMLICFFVIIAPIIVILNTINKIRGKGSDMLSNWLKEFIANVVMQPIDALMFTVILSGISFCLGAEPKQPLIALAFLFGYFPLRSWVLKFFGQEPSQNSQDAAKGMVSKGFAAVGKGVNGAFAVASNVSKIPALKDTRFAKMISKAEKAKNVFPDGSPKGVPVATGYEPSKDAQAGYTEMTGNTNEASSYSNDRTSTNAVGNKNRNTTSNKESKIPKPISRGLGIGLRAAAVAAPKMIGAGLGVAATAINVGAGNGAKGFKATMNATESAINGIPNVPTTAKKIIDMAKNSRVITGENGRYDRLVKEQQALESLVPFMQQKFMATANEQQIAAINEAPNKIDFIMDTAIQDAVSDPRYDKALAVFGGDKLKAVTSVLEMQKASWKNEQKKSSTNVGHKQGNASTTVRHEHGNSGAIEVHEHGNSRTIEVQEHGGNNTTVVHRNENGGTIEVQEHGGNNTTVVHRNGNGGTIEVQEHGGNNTTVVHRNGNGGTIEVQEHGGNNTTVVHTTGNSGTIEVNGNSGKTVISGNNNVVTETVDNVEEADINRDLKDFIMDSKTEELAYDLIETIGEGDPLYEEYNRISDQAGKRAIALEFLFAKAKDNWNEKDLTQIVRSKNHQELQRLFKK